MRLLKLVTTYQSAVTILYPKLRILEKLPGIELVTASSFEDPSEIRRAPGLFEEVFIPRTIDPLRDIKAIYTVCRIIRKHRIDLIHTHTAKAGIVGAVAGYLSGIPVLHTYHSLPFFERQKRLPYLIYRALEVFCSRFRKGVFCQNRQDVKVLSKIKAFKCPYVFEGNGVDLEYLHASAGSHAVEVEKYFGDRDRVHILCVARLEPVKHLQTVIEAISWLKGQGRAVDCIIAGKGPLEREIGDVIRSCGVGDVVTVAYTPFVHALINKADILVLTSIKEGIPRGLMEGMGLGKPAVATDVLGTQELVRDGQTGFLVPFGDQDAFNAALMKLVDDPALRRRMGESGKQVIASEYDEKRIVELWVETYRQLLPASWVAG